MLMLIPFTGLAQDIHFTQFYNSPLNLNPSSTGDFVGKWRLSGSFRSQWGGQDLKSYRTSTIGFDLPVALLGKEFGVGGLLINDRSHNALIVNNKLYGSLGYKKQFGSHHVSGGIQLGYAHSAPGEFTFPQQYVHDPYPANGFEGGGYDNSIDNGEPNEINSRGYFDSNLGINWKKRFGSKFESKVGFALFHVFTTNTSLNGGNAKMPLRSSIYATPKFILNDKIVLAPHIQYMNSKSNSSTLLGSNAIVRIPKNKPNIKNVYLGAMTSIAKSKSNGNLQESGTGLDGVGFIAGLQFPHLDVGLSYDVMMSNVASYFGNPFELTFIYIAPNTLFNRRTLPCDRL